MLFFDSGLAHGSGGGYNTPVLIPDDDGFSSQVSNIYDVFQSVAENIAHVKETLEQIISKLNDISKDASFMAADYNYKMMGLPISDAIGTFRFMVGEVIFSTLYVLILLGILFTLFTIAYKLAQLCIYLWQNYLLKWITLARGV